MPIIKSAKKRVKTANKAAIRNSKTKRSLRTAIKAFHAAITGGDKKGTVTAHGQAQSELDKAGKKHVMHKNKVARKKRQLSKAAKAASTAAAPVAKKAAIKKKTTAVEKAVPVKKPAVKKAPAKKPAAKK